jgi:hypothetical protein
VQRAAVSRNPIEGSRVSSYQAPSKTTRAAAFSEQLAELRAKAVAGGGEKRVQQQHGKGKLTARERIEVFAIQRRLQWTPDWPASMHTLNMRPPTYSKFAPLLDFADDCV